jgi:hypothetical protein
LRAQLKGSGSDAAAPAAVKALPAADQAKVSKHVLSILEIIALAVVPSTSLTLRSIVSNLLFALQLLDLTAMGIDAAWAAAALRRTHNDAAAAVALCFETDMAAAVASDAASDAAAADEASADASSATDTTEQGEGFNILCTRLLAYISAIVHVHNNSL